MDATLPYLARPLHYLSELITLIVRGPKYPTAGDIPFAAWNLARAFCVAGPNVVVSAYLEPTPVVDTVKLWVFRKTWRYFTSIPVEPMVRERRKVGTEEEVVVVTEVDTAAEDPARDARVRGPTVPVADMPFDIWYFITAASVRGPKYPVAVPLNIP